MAKNAEIEQTVIEAPYELPEGWKWCRLGEVVEVLNGYAFKSENYVHQGIRVIRITNVQDGYIEDLKPCFYPKEYSNDLSQYTLYENDLLISLTGNVGRVALLPKNFLPAALNQRVGCLREKNNQISKKYIAYYLRQHKFLSDCIKSSKGTAQLNMSTEWLKRYPIPLPPTLAEQQRIVNRIETMFEKLDQAQKKAQAVLDSFETRKAAILHKAFSGQLRIDNEELTIDDWEDTTIEECIKLFSGQDFKPEDYNAEENGIPYITGASNFAENHVLINRWTSKPSVIAKKDDVLLVCKGSGYGKTIIADFEEAHIARQIMALRIPKNMSNRFILYFLQNNYEYLRNGGQGLIPGIARNIVLQMPIKLPPLNYQLSIVNCLDTVLEKESRAKEAAQTVLDQIALLKKSILARAFRGEL